MCEGRVVMVMVWWDVIDWVGLREVWEEEEEDGFGFNPC